MAKDVDCKLRDMFLSKATPAGAESKEAITEEQLTLAF